MLPQKGSLGSRIALETTSPHTFPVLDWGVGVCLTFPKTKTVKVKKEQGFKLLFLALFFNLSTSLAVINHNFCYAGWTNSSNSIHIYNFSLLFILYIIHVYWRTVLCLYNYKNILIIVPFYHVRNITSNILMSLQHYSTIMLWLGSRPFFTSQQLAPRLQQVSETACSHMHAYAQQHEHMRAETHTCPIGLPCSYGHTKFCTSTNVQMTPWVFFSPKHRCMLRKWALKGSNLTLKAWWINRIALITC